MTHKIQIPEGTARRMQLRQVWGDLLWKRSREPERSVDSRRQLPDADDFPSPAPELASNALIAGHVVFAFAVPEGAVGFGAGVALGAAVPEASVDKDGNRVLGKREVSLSGQRQIPSPDPWNVKCQDVTPPALL